VAQAAAALFPERIAGLALIGTLGAPAHGSYRLLSLPGVSPLMRVVGALFRVPRLRPLAREILRRAMRDIFSPEAVPEARLERELDLFATHPQILVSMAHVTLGRPCAQLLATAPDIRCPTLFLHGEADALVPPACARAIHDCIERAGGSSRFQSIAGAGHLLIEYQAEEVAGNIIRWLSDVQRI
jgi:pimeloyl-ACP methyl ester carboxylesterase